MKSKVEVEINKPLPEVADLFFNPANNPKWMEDLERYEPVSGEQGRLGSAYRLIPKKGNMIFLATVVAQSADEVKLNFEASNVRVLIKGKLVALPAARTKLISEEEFIFKGLFNSLFGFLVQKSIKAVHRHHIQNFKRFAEK